MVMDSQDRVCRVLVVDDHPDTAEVMSVMFKLLGHEAQAALRGREALRAVRELDYDLIVLDIGLPDISGYEVLNALRADPNRFVVGMSGWDRPTDIARARQAGFDAYFVKPIDLAKIRDILRMTLGTARALHDLVE
jgi:CheY-like chemotaxis protein